MQFLHILKNKLKKKIKKFVAQKKIKMAAIKMATKTKFGCKNYKSSFFKKKIWGCFSCLNPKFLEKKILKNSRWRPYLTWRLF
jgi:hypothetical protein